MDYYQQPIRPYVTPSNGCSSVVKTIAIVAAVVFNIVTFSLAVYATVEMRRWHDGDVKLTLRGNSVPLGGGAQAHDGSDRRAGLFIGAGSWHDQKSLASSATGKRSDLQAVAAGEYVYLFGGVDLDTSTTPNSVRTLRAIEKYDVVRQEYSSVTNLRTAHSQFGAGAFKSSSGDVETIVIAGGLVDSAAANENLQTDLFSVATESISAGPNLQEAHLDGCMASTGDAVYMIGGWTSGYSSHSAKVEKLTKGGSSWSYVAELPEPRGDCAAAALNGKVYVVGGYYSESYDASEGMRNTLYEYDPERDEWTQKASMRHARGDLQLVARDNSLLAIGGEVFHTNSDGEHRDKVASHFVEEYYPDSDHWEHRAMLGQGRFRFGAAVTHWGVHVFGGSAVCAEPASPTDYSTCDGLQIDSHEVFFEAEHPQITVDY
jgi:N-acetylneuraminic acid mutarotase